MSHEVTAGTRVVVIGESSWHRIDNKFPVGTKMLAREAVTAAGMDDGIRREHPVVTIDGETIQLPDLATFRIAPDGSRHYMGVQSAEFTPISNMELAGLIDDSGITKEFPVATAGSLREGRVSFITLDVGMTTIGGENVGQYMAINDGKDGSRGLNLLYTNVREVCANTVAMAEGSSKLNLQLVHRPSVRGDFEMALDLMAAIKETAKQHRARLERLTTKKLKIQTVEQILEAAYPITDRGGKAAIYRELVEAGKFDSMSEDRKKELRKAHYISEQAASRALERRAAAYRNWERICGDSALLKPSLRGTGWSLFNAITEEENHRDGWGNVAESILIGDRNKTMMLALKAVEAA
jgi:hypothetical protein